MTEKSLDHILAQCLEEAERTGDIGAALRGHPEHADELRPLLELAFVARRLYAEVPPPPGGLAWGRARLLSQARRAHSVARADDRVVARRERGSPVLSRLATAFMAAGAAVAILAFGLVAVIRAADGAVPGHPLYGLDRGLEQVEARLTRDPSSLAQLRLRLAEERLGEVAQLVQAEDQSHLEEALGAYSDAVVALARVAGAGQGTGDLAAALALDRVLASHEKQLRSALQGAGGGEDDPWCTGQGTHPVAAALARRYAVEADTVMSWFCEDNFGLGEIMHALQTSELLSGTGVPSDTTPAALLALKADLGGWGQVWQELGLIGRPSEPSPPGQEDKPEPPGQENKPEPPGQEDKPEPPGQEDKPEPPGQDDKSVPPGQTKTPEPPGQDDKSVPPGQDDKSVPPGQDDKSVPPGQTKTPEPTGQEDKLEPPGEDDKPVPPGEDDKSVPPGQDDKSVPPGQDDKPVPPGQEDKSGPPGRDKKT